MARTLELAYGDHWLHMLSKGRAPRNLRLVFVFERKGRSYLYFCVLCLSFSSMTGCKCPLEILVTRNVMLLRLLELVAKAEPF